MCSQNAGNVSSKPQILKIFRGEYPRTPKESLSTSPPRQNQNFTPVM